jgi:AraC-like DNA-binding protein
MAQIAAMLSFSEQSALSRAVRRWCAASSREVRARAHDKLSSKVK